MKGYFQHLVEGAIYRLNDQQYYATASQTDRGIWELHNLSTGRLSYLILPNGDMVSNRTKGPPRGVTIGDLEFVRADDGRAMA